MSKRGEWACHPPYSAPSQELGSGSYYGGRSERDGGPVPPLLAVVLIPPVVVLLLGSMQWLLLRREFDGAGWWPFINIGGLILGFSVGLTVAKIVPWLEPTDFPSPAASVVIAPVAGLVYGAVTWPLFARLRRRAAPPDPPRGLRG